MAALVAGMIEKPSAKRNRPSLGVADTLVLKNY